MPFISTLVLEFLVSFYTLQISTNKYITWWRDTLVGCNKKGHKRDSTMKLEKIYTSQRNISLKCMNNPLTIYARILCTISTCENIYLSYNRCSKIKCLLFFILSLDNSIFWSRAANNIRSLQDHNKIILDKMREENNFNKFYSLLLSYEES